MGLEKKWKPWIYLALMLFLSVVMACKKRPELQPPTDKVKGISGSWILYKTEQVDVNNKLGNIRSDTVMDVTKWYLGSNTPMTLQITQSGAYSISAGVGDMFFKKMAGTWKFDNNSYPSWWMLDNGMPEALNIQLLGPTRPQDNDLILKAVKYCKGKRTVAYNLWYKRN